MKKINFQISVPSWLYRFRWSNIEAWVSYHLNPYRCSCCKKKMPFNNVEIWVGNNLPLTKRLGISYHGKDIWCQDCLVKRVQETAVSKEFTKIEKMNSHYELNVAKKCDVCKQEAPSFKFFYFDKKQHSGDRLHFCVDWWNGSHVCLDCIVIGLRYGEARNNIYHQYKGKSTSVNGFGLPVVKGKVRFPE